MNLLTPKKRVAVIFGGISPEHDVSVLGAEFFVKALKGSEYVPIPVYITRSGAWYIYSAKSSPADIANGSAVGVSTYPVRLGCKSGFMLFGRILPVFAAVPLLHGEGGEDGVVQGVLKSAGIDYVGADTVASSLAFNKAYTKAIAETIGIPTVPWIYLNRRIDVSVLEELSGKVESELSYPVFVKPATLGSSFGCASVYSKKELFEAVKTAARLSDNKVIVERMLESPRELEVAYFETKSEEIFTNPGEINVENGFYSFTEKYSRASRANVSETASLSSADTELILGYSKALVRALGIRHISRIDFFMSGGKIYFNEINTMPGMSEASLYPRLISRYGFSPQKMASELVNVAVKPYDRHL